MPAASGQLIRSALSACVVVLSFHPEDVAGLARGGRVESAIAVPQTAVLIERKCKIPLIVSHITIEKAAGGAATTHRDLLEVLLESEANAVAAENAQDVVAQEVPTTAPAAAKPAAHEHNPGQLASS